jgi:hypothetical protein
MLPRAIAAMLESPPRTPTPIGLREAYALAMRLERERAAMAVPGYRLYWMTASRFACRDVVADPSSFLIAGRHTCAPVVLADDPTIALRHLLVRSGCTDDGCPTLSLLDLRTHQGFELSDGSAQRAIFATGPIALRVGAYSIVALPSGARLPEELPHPVCDRRPLAAAAPRPAEAQRPGQGPYRDLARSRITLLPAACILSQRESFRPGPSGPGTIGGSVFEVVLRGERGTAAVFFSKEELGNGVLLGRDPKCIDAGLRPLLTIGISRVHLLLLREGGQCHAYDLASTQGTYQAGTYARHVKLEDEGTVLSLGQAANIELGWRALG